MIVKPREFGPNQGIPTIHIEVEEGSDKVEDLLFRVVNGSGNLKNVFVGYRIVKGLHAFLSGLNSMKFDLEIQFLGDCETPSWLNSPSLVLVNYISDSKFNVFSLRREDFILFDINTKIDLEKAKLVFEETYLTPATKWLIVPRDLYLEGYELVLSYLRTRISIKEEVKYEDYTTNNKVEVSAGS